MANCEDKEKNGDSLSYNPDYAIHPGELLRDELAEMPRSFVLELPDVIVDDLFLLMTEKRVILSWSNEGNIVYDPFMGSGTTAKMAKLANRHYIGSEISAEYCEIAERRVRETYVQEKLLTA